MDYVDLEGKTFMAVPGHTLKPKYEFGTMTHFAYRVEGGAEGEELVVATTRLETMLGDTVRFILRVTGTGMADLFFASLTRGLRFG